MKNLRKNNLDELTELMPTISKIKQSGYLGGGMVDPAPIDPNAQPVGGGGDSYTLDEAQAMINSGTWHGGMVDGAYMSPQVTIFGGAGAYYTVSEFIDSAKTTKTDLFKSFIYGQFEGLGITANAWDATQLCTKVDLIKALYSSGLSLENVVFLQKSGSGWAGPTWEIFNCLTGKEIALIVEASVSDLPNN